MAEVQPFRGLRFAGMPLGEVIAPPFDVISPEQQARLYDRSPYNVVRLELGRESDRYAEARRCFQQWREAGVLQQDEPSFYVYEQQFFGDQVRRGLFARVKLEPWSAGVVLPHEETLTKPKADRLNLVRAVQANVSPVFSMYEDPSKQLTGLLAEVCATVPTQAGQDETGEEHRLWQVKDPGFLARITEFFDGRQLFIADGHHRYETALAYRDEAATPEARYVLMALVDFNDPGLVVQPTHRLVNGLSGAMLRQLADQIGDYFEVVSAAEEPSPRSIDAALGQLPWISAPAYVLYGPKPGGLRTLRLRSEWQSTIFESAHSIAWNQLDVAVLHSVLGRILGVDAEDLANQRYFSYVQEPREAVRQVQAETAQLALLLRPTPATAIRDVALAHDKMPQKSTYFYPKLATGVVINPLS